MKSMTETNLNCLTFCIVKSNSSSGDSRWDITSLICPGKCIFKISRLIRPILNHVLYTLCRCIYIIIFSSMCGHYIRVCINLVTCAQGFDRKVVTRSMSQIRITRYYIVSRSFTVAEHAQLSDERRYDYECKLYSSMSNPTQLFHSLDYDKLPDETIAILHVYVFQEYISIH